MKVDGKPYRTIWLAADGRTVQVIDQTMLPHAFVVRDLATLEDAERSIRTMIVRGAPLIGATAAYGVGLAMAADPSDAMLAHAYRVLLAARPTAVNLRWALDDLRGLLALGFDEITLIPYAVDGGTRAEMIAALSREVIAPVRGG